jgi:hypothetical protein
MMWGDYRIATQADVDAGGNASINTPPTEVGDAFGEVDWSGERKVTSRYLPDAQSGPPYLTEVYNQPLLNQMSWSRLLKKLHPSLQMTTWGGDFDNLEPGAWGGCQVRPYSPPGYYRGDLVKIYDEQGDGWKVWKFNEDGGSASGYGTGDDAPGGANNKWEYIGEDGDSLGWVLTGAKGAFYSESYLDSGNKQEMKEWWMNAGKLAEVEMECSTRIFNSDDVSITCRGSKVFASEKAAINWVIWRAKKREKLGFSWYDHKVRKWAPGRNWLWENINTERVHDFGGWGVAEGYANVINNDQNLPYVEYGVGERAWFKGELYEVSKFARGYSPDQSGFTYGFSHSTGGSKFYPQDSNGLPIDPAGKSVAIESEYSPWWIKSGGGSFKLPALTHASDETTGYWEPYELSLHQGETGVREGRNLAGTMSIFPGDYFDTQEEAEAFARNPQPASEFNGSNGGFVPGGPYKAHPGFTDEDLIEVTEEWCDKHGAAGAEGNCTVIYIGGGKHEQCLARMRGICDSWEEKIGNALPGGTIIPNGELFLSMLGSAKWKDSWEDTGNKVDTD